MGPSVDPKFDELLQSLGKVAQKHPKPVVDSLLRWRKSQKDGSLTEVQPTYSSNAKLTRTHDAAALLTDRRLLASTYITCRALAAVTKSLSKDSLSDVLGNQLEELTFAQFRNPDVKTSPNHRANTELYAEILGNLANIRYVVSSYALYRVFTSSRRFESVTDRFRVELGPVAAGQVSKDFDFKYEHLIKGLQHVQIKVIHVDRSIHAFALSQVYIRCGRLKASRKGQSSSTRCPSRLKTPTGAGLRQCSRKSSSICFTASGRYSILSKSGHFNTVTDLNTDGAS